MNQEIHKPDSDLEDAFQFNPQSELELSDITQQLATVPGEADGLDWHWIVKLKDGNYAYLTGGCDYTGWDCQSNLFSKKANTLLEVLELVEKDGYNEPKKSIKQQLRDQLEGEQPYGLREE